MNQETAIRTIRFRYTKPSKFVAGLGETPKGISAILPADTQMRLTVRGEREAVELLAQMAELADVKPLRYTLVLQLVRYGKTGKREATLEKKSLLLDNKAPFSSSLGGGVCEAQGTLHGSPGEVQLTFEAKAFRKLGLQRQPAEALNATRRVPFGKIVQIARFEDPRLPPRLDKKLPGATLVLEAQATPALVK